MAFELQYVFVQVNLMFQNTKMLGKKHDFAQAERRNLI